VAGAWCLPPTSFQCRVANGLELYLRQPFVPAYASRGLTFLCNRVCMRVLQQMTIYANGAYKTPNATGGVHSKFQSTATVFIGTLLHLCLLKGMEFHLGFKPHTYSMFYTITLCNFVAPMCSVCYVILFRETGVVHRITYSFNYFFFTCFIYSFYS